MKILIVGHGEYATGVKSAIKLLTGVDEKIDAINLNDEITHESFKVIASDYVKKYSELVIFADITGGAPFQITSREVLLNEDSDNQYVIGGCSLGCILEIVMNTVVIESQDTVKEIIDNTLNMIREMATVMCRKDLIE